jgi:hypothetical protein
MRHLLVFALIFLPACLVQAGEIVTVKNFVRAESDLYIKKCVMRAGIDKLVHFRNPTPLLLQGVIRMNRDTLYSFAAMDLNKPVQVTLPDAGDRYMSLQVINQDHHTKLVTIEPGDYTFTQESVGTRYGVVIIRTLIDDRNPADIQEVNQLQDKIVYSTEPTGKLEIPDWDLESHKQVRDALLTLAESMPDTSHCFGDADEVDPIAHLVGAAVAWGGMPRSSAVYDNIHPPANDGQTPYKLTVRDVPVDGFWSITVYNANGMMVQNERSIYVINDRNAVKNDDGSVTIHFGGDPDKPNFMPIMAGWNYTVRQFRPRVEILRGLWKFPIATPVIAPTMAATP